MVDGWSVLAVFAPSPDLSNVIVVSEFNHQLMFMTDGEGRQIGCALIRKYQLFDFTGAGQSLHTRLVVGRTIVQKRDRISSIPHICNVSITAVLAAMSLKEVLTEFPFSSRPSQSPTSDCSFWNPATTFLLAASNAEQRPRIATTFPAPLLFSCRRLRITIVR